MEIINNWFIYVDSITISMLPKTSIGIATFVGLLVGYFAGRKVVQVDESGTKEDKERADLLAVICCVFFLVGTVCNGIYAFFLSPEHYLPMTKIILFVLPYLGLIFLSFYLNMREKRK